MSTKLDPSKITKGKELVQFVEERHEEVLQEIAAAKESTSRVEGALASLKLMVNDANRTPVAALSDKGEAVPVTKDAWLQYGMKAVLLAPLPVERKANGELTTGDGPIATFHAKSDELLIFAKLMRLKTREEIRETKFYKEHYVPAYRAAEKHVCAKGAFDISEAGAGLEFIATDLSGSLVEMVEVERRAMSLFESLPMQHGILTVPVWLTHATAYGFDENTSDTGGTAIPDGLTAGMTGNFQIAAKGIGLALTTSKYTEEDSVIPWLPFLRRAGIRALVNGEEDAGFNGDTTATHMDADINAVTAHVAKRWKGLRYVGLLSANPAKIDCQGNPINSDVAFRDYVLKGLGLMDKYGTIPGDLVLFAPALVNAQLLSVEAFKTMYARGPAATNVNGIIRSPFGWDYCLTAYLRTNLASGGVNTSGLTTVDKTSALLVHKGSWKKGIVRQVNVQLLDQTRALYDQDQLVFTMRQGFISARKMDGTEPHVSDLYDIAAA